MTELRPKLVVSGAAEAIELYRAVFGAEERSRYTVGGVIVEAELRLLGGTILLKEADEHDPSPTTLGRPGVVIDVVTEQPDHWADAMVAAGGTTVFEVADQPYGARGGRVRDPFGHEWLLQTPISLTPEEIQAALDAMAG